MLSAYTQVTFLFDIYFIKCYNLESLYRRGKKMKNFKKFVALFMTLVIVLCSFSFAVYAEDK